MRDRGTSLGACAAVLALLAGCFDGLPEQGSGGAARGRDRSFGLPAVAVSTADDQANAVAVGADGAVYLAGEASIDHAGRIDKDATLVKLTAGGAPDASFGTNGVVTLDFGLGDDEALGVAVDASGRVLVTGLVEGGSTSPRDDLFVARFTTAGALDATFGAGGVRRVDVAGDDDRGTGIALSGTTIYVVGRAENGNSATRDILVVALDDAGSLLASFDADGKRSINVAAAEDAGDAIGVLSGGDIVVAGLARQAAGDTAIAVARLTPGGAATAGFGTAGVVTIDLGPSADEASALAIDASGRVLVLAQVTAAGGADPSELALLRLDPASGALDATFGAGGVVRTTLGADVLEAEGLLAHPNGRIFVSGAIADGEGEDLLLAAFTSQGTLDTSVGAGGVQRVDRDGRKDKGHGIALAPTEGGRFVIASEVESGAGDDDHGAARFFPE